MNVNWAVGLCFVTICISINIDADDEVKKQQDGASTKMTKEQKIILDKEFENHFYIAEEDRQKLSKSLNLTLSEISKWYIRKRHFYRLKHPDAFTIKPYHRFSKQQRVVLTDDFDKYPNKFQNWTYRARLADSLNTTERKVRTWYYWMLRRKKIKANLPVENRVRFTPREKAVMEEQFLKNMAILNRERLIKIQGTVNISESRIRRWFTYKRSVMKKENNNTIRFRELRMLSGNQRKVLRDEFEKTKYPSVDKIAELAILTGVSVDKVRRWFQSKRYLEKIAGRGGNDTKPRSIFTDEQRQVLEKEFADADGRYPKKARRIELAGRLGINETKLKYWFVNKKSRSKGLKKGSQRPIEDTKAAAAL